MQAVRTNLPAYVNYNNGTVNMAFVTTDPSPGSTYVQGNPDVALSGAVSFQPPSSSAGFHTQLDTYLGGGTPLINQVIGFNARGLPCVAGANPAVCTAYLGGFEWFMQSNAGWEAVTVTPAGRIKSWRLSGQSGGSYTWQ